MSSFVKGLWKAECDRCGFWFKSNKLKLEWTGQRVCYGSGTNDCYEVRHPQEYLRGISDHQATPWSRPAGQGVDVSPGSGNEVSEADL